MTGLTPLDTLVVVAYLVGILAAGIWSTRKQALTGNVYFLAGRSLNWAMIGAALFASNISTIHLIGLAAAGYTDGLVWGNFEWMAVLTLILLGLVFAPFYFRTKISTLPEFLERRYGPESRAFLAFMGIVAALFIHIGMSLYAAAAVFERFAGIDTRASILVISLVTGIYTVAGGLKAVVVTEAIQTVFLLAGAIGITAASIAALPGHGIRTWSEFHAAAKPDQLSMIHQQSAAGLEWYAVLLGYPVLGVWYWCTDQTIVQRVLGAKTEADARNGPLFAGLLKILPVFIMVLPGVIGYVLYRDVIGKDANQTLPILIDRLAPSGFKGLILAGLLAALMSTVASALNSCATLVAVDIVGRIRPGESDAAQVRIGRVAAVVVMLLAMFWSSFGSRYNSIFEAINAIASELAPPITTVFVWGVFWRRGTRQASLATLIFGFLLGGLLFVLDLPVVGTTKLITVGMGIPFLMQAWWAFCLCSLVFVGVSLATPAPPAAQLIPVTWDGPSALLASGDSRSRRFAGLLLVTLAVLYWLFR